MTVESPNRLGDLSAGEIPVLPESERRRLLKLVSKSDNPIAVVQQENKKGLLRLPGSVGIIADGNGRWAKKRGLSATAGHIEGAKRIAELIRSCRMLKPIHTVVVWAMSPDNVVKRDKAEIAGLIGLTVEYLHLLMPELLESDGRFVHLGSKEGLDDAAAELEKSENETAGNKGQTVALALNYDGKTHVREGYRRFHGELKEGVITDLPTDEDIDRVHAQAPVGQLEVMIRTGMTIPYTMHTSGIGWIADVAQWYPTRTLLPNFKSKGLARILINNAAIERRQGGRPNNSITPS